MSVCLSLSFWIDLGKQMIFFGVYLNSKIKNRQCEWHTNRSSTLGKHQFSIGHIMLVDLCQQIVVEWNWTARILDIQHEVLSEGFLHRFVLRPNEGNIMFSMLEQNQKYRDHFDRGDSLFLLQCLKHDWYDQEKYYPPQDSFHRTYTFDVQWPDNIAVDEE